MYVYEVDYNGRVEEVEAESFEEAAEVWMAMFAPEEEEAVVVFVVDKTGVRRKIAVYAEKSITYYAEKVDES